MESRCPLIVAVGITWLVLATLCSNARGVDTQTLKTGHCFHADAVRVLQHQTIQACEEACEALSICKSFSYNRQISACFLRVNFYREDETPDTVKRCFNFNRTNSKDTDDTTKGTPAATPGTQGNTEPSSEEKFCFAKTNIPNALFFSALPAFVGHKNSLCCEKGFTGFGKSSLTCQPNGSFTETDFRCVKNCPYPPKETATAKLLSWNTYRFVENTTAFYQCNEGFYNFTLPQIVCGTSGEWSTYECLPACNCKTVSPIRNGYVIPKKSQWYTVNDTTQYACNDSYYLSIGSPVLSCDIQGRWSIPAVSCYPYCTQDAVPFVANSEVVPGENYTYNMQAEYQCNEGHYFGNEHRHVTCGTDGQWSKAEVLCYPYCTVPKAPDNGFLKATNVQYRADEVVDYDCNNGYYQRPVRFDETKCDVNGEWSMSPECYKHCPNPPSYEWGKIHINGDPPYTIDNTYTFKCNMFLDIDSTDGINHNDCQKGGEWTDRIGCCAFPFKYCSGGELCKWRC